MVKYEDDGEVLRHKKTTNKTKGATQNKFYMWSPHKHAQLILRIASFTKVMRK